MIGVLRANGWTLKMNYGKKKNIKKEILIVAIPDDLQQNGTKDAITK